MNKLIFLAILFFSTVAFSDVTLQWDANTEPDLAGYNVYWATINGAWSPPIYDNEDPVLESEISNIVMQKDKLPPGQVKNFRKK